MQQREPYNYLNFLCRDIYQHPGTSREILNSLWQLWWTVESDTSLESIWSLEFMGQSTRDLLVAQSCPRGRSYTEKDLQISANWSSWNFDWIASHADIEKDITGRAKKRFLRGRGVGGGKNSYQRDINWKITGIHSVE